MGLYAFDYPDRQELRTFFSEVASLAIERAVEDETLFDHSSTLIVGDWGEGEANEGDDLEVILSYNYEEDEDTEYRSKEDSFPEEPFSDMGVHEGFDDTPSHAEDIITSARSGAEDTSNIDSWFGEIDITVILSSIQGDVVSWRMDSPGSTIYDLQLDQVYIYREVPLDNLDIRQRQRIEDDDIDADHPTEVAPIPLSEFLELIPPIDERYVPEDQRSQQEVQEQLLELEYPDITPELRGFAIDNERVAIPVGTGTRKIYDRDPYDFEIEMATPGSNDTPLEIDEGIGLSLASGRFGNEDPPSTFPRTGLYIKNRLKHEGPAYIAELHRDLVYYSGYISRLHEFDARPGTEQSFRQFMYRLRESDERLGVQLIEELSQQAVAGMGKSLNPTLPNGDPAPWLEQRKFYKIVEENAENDIWEDITGEIYEH